MAHKEIKSLVYELRELIASKDLNNTFSVDLSATGNAINVRNSCSIWDNAELIFDWAARYKSSSFIASYVLPQYHANYLCITIIPYENED